jgi:hypothetical protein
MVPGSVTLLDVVVVAVAATVAGALELELEFDEPQPAAAIKAQQTRIAGMRRLGSVPEPKTALGAIASPGPGEMP